MDKEKNVIKTLAQQAGVHKASVEFGARDEGELEILHTFVVEDGEEVQYGVVWLPLETTVFEAMKAVAADIVHRIKTEEALNQEVDA